MKIKGSRDYIKFDMENGYVLKAAGEMLAGHKFIVYRNSMKNWEPPHDDEPLTKEQIEEIIHTAQSRMSAGTVQLIFE
jgi:hypothetical protein